MSERPHPAEVSETCYLHAVPFLLSPSYHPFWEGCSRRCQVLRHVCKRWYEGVPGTLWTSHWTPRSGHPDHLLQPGSSQTRVASVTKQNHPELATMINKMLTALVKTVVSFTGWDIWVAVLLTNIFSLSCCYLFFFFWACSSLYLLPVSWEHVTQKLMSSIWAC